MNRIFCRARKSHGITTPYPTITNEVDGVEYDKFGNPILYHVSSEHPGDSSLWYGMGGPIHQTEYVPFGQSVTVNGQTFEGELYIIRKMTLKEISFVDLAADENTSAVIEAQLEEKDNLEMTNVSEQKTEPKPEPAAPVVTPVAPQVDTLQMIPPEQVVEIAETGNLISDDGTIELIRYIAFLNGVFSNDAE